MRFERRLDQPRWLIVAVPVGSIAVAFVLMAFVLLLTGHAPGPTYRRLFDSAFFGNGALSATLVTCTPILFTGLAAAAAFRMQLYNIGGEGQFYFGAIAAVGLALYLGDRGLDSTPVYIAAMALAGAVAGAAWAAIPALLRAFAHTNEIITSLMLNYVAGLVLTYLMTWPSTQTSGALRAPSSFAAAATTLGFSHTNTVRPVTAAAKSGGWRRSCRVLRR